MEEPVFAPLTEADARQIAGWHYPPPYDEYDMPDWETVVRQNWGIADPARRAAEFTGLYTAGQLIGYYRLQPLSESTALLGLGLRPDCCGQGLGTRLLPRVFCHIRACGWQRLELEVRRQNQRALRCYARCGFTVQGEPYRRSVLGTDCWMIRMARAL